MFGARASWIDMTAPPRLQAIARYLAHEHPRPGHQPGLVQVSGERRFEVRPLPTPERPALQELAAVARHGR